MQDTKTKWQTKMVTKNLCGHKTQFKATSISQEKRFLNQKLDKLGLRKTTHTFQ
jgi:hypothetical protein